MKQQEYRGLECLWKPIVRPSRHQYKLKDLGKEVTMIVNTVTKRSDFEIVNKRKQTLQQSKYSLFEPVRTQDKAHPCMIYLHGNSSSRLESLTIVEYLIPMNISVCGIDLSGSGHSEGEFISLGYYESQDVQALYEYLKEHKPFITKIGLWGRSMGSVTAILSASSNQNFKVLVCDSPFSNLTQLCKEFASSTYKIPGCCFSCFWCFVKSKIRTEAKFNIDDLNIVQTIQTLNTDVSIVFFSAKQDTLIAQKHPKLLHDKFRGNKELKIFDGTHNSKRPADVMRDTAQYIIQNFGQDAWEIGFSARNTRIQTQNVRDQYNNIQFEEAQPIISDNNTQSRLDKKQIQ